MSKFRARALDASRDLAVYRTEYIPDLAEYAAINRTVPQMPTGMEKEEETEKHLKEAIETRQFYGSQGATFIPTPGVTTCKGTAHRIYRQDITQPEEYIRVSGLGIEEEQPDYDMDSDDEVWLNAQSKDRPISPLQFETMMDRLEKGSGNTVMTEQEAQMLLKDNPDLVVAVYDYWLSKRIRLKHALIPGVRTDKRDGTSGNNPYIAFRKRMEKMQTRKNRKNDEVAYMYMVKLRREMARIITLTKLVKEREEKKHNVAKLALDIFRKRYQLSDWSGAVYAQLAQEYVREPAATKSLSTRQAQLIDDDWSPTKPRDLSDEVRHVGRHEVLVSRKKVRRKKAVKGSSSAERLHYEPRVEKATGTEELRDSLQERSEDEAPDGVFTFYRRPNVKYYRFHGRSDPIPWNTLSARHERLSRKQLFSEAYLGGHALGLARRRLGRGGRLLWDCVPLRPMPTATMDDSHIYYRPDPLGPDGEVEVEGEEEGEAMDMLYSDLFNAELHKEARTRPVYRSRSPSPSLPLQSSYQPSPNLSFIQGHTPRAPWRHFVSPPSSAFLTPLSSEHNKDRTNVVPLTSFLGQPSSFFHLSQGGARQSRIGHQARPVGGKGGLGSQTVSKMSENADVTSKSDVGPAFEKGSNDDLMVREGEDLPSSLTMKIRIEKHYNNGTGDKKVAFVVASTSASSDHTEDEVMLASQDSKGIEDGASERPAQSLDGPNTAVLDLNTNQTTCGDSSSLRQLFCLPVPTLLVPQVYSEASQSSVAAVAVASLPQSVAASPHPADFALHLAHYRLSTEQFQELQQANSTITSSSSPAVTPVPLLTLGERHQPLSSGAPVQGGLVSSTIPSTGIPSAPNSPAVTVSPAGMAPGGVSPQLNSHLSLPLTATPHLIPQQRSLSMDSNNNGMDTNQLKQALVGAVPLVKHASPLHTVDSQPALSKLASPSEVS